MDSSFAPRVLLVLPQLPQDPAAGAPRSLTSISELLASSGFQVRCLAVTASESAATDARAVLHELGIKFSVQRRKRPEILFERRGICFRLLDIGSLSVHRWQEVFNRNFDDAFDDELRTFNPDIVFTYGGTDADRRRFHRARNAGAKVVFGLRNEGFLTTFEWHRELDAILTPSRYLTDLYRDRIGIESTPFATPMAADEVVAEDRDPIFLTMVNPSFEKGVVVFARLAEELSKQRPDLPILVIESRASAGLLAGIGEKGGFDLRRHENIMFSPAVATPKDVYVPTRILVVPSLREAAGRVVAEALMNGIPPLVSNRGGLSEMAGDAGHVFAIPDSISVLDREPVAAEIIQPWVQTIIPLFDNDDLYRLECERAKKAAERFSPEVLLPQYKKYFMKVIGCD